MTTFNYESYEGGYQHSAMHHGPSVQKFWHKKKLCKILDLTGCTHEKVILDIGCGAGNATFTCAKRAKLTIGLDVSASALKFCKDLRKESECTNAHFVKIGTKGEIPVCSQSVDRIILSEVIEHLDKDVRSALWLEIKRALKPEGKLIITTPNALSMWPAIEFLLDLFNLVPSLEEQHVFLFNKKSLLSELSQFGFSSDSSTSIFFISPFLSIISVKLADMAYSIEEKIDFLPKMILCVSCVVSQNRNLR